jgi:ketosteroid isomerase-like protein
MHWTPSRIDVASPTVATEYGTYTDSYDTPTGKVSDAGSYVTIWHKVNGKWRVALDAPVSSMPVPAPEPSSVRRLMADFTAAAERVNPTEVFSYFSRSPDFAAADNGTLYTSVDSLSRVYTGVFAQLQSQDVVTNESKVVVLSPTSAIVTGSGTFSPVNRAGVRSAPRGFNWTFLWVREPGGWKVLQSHQSFVPMSQ